ncbi:MAG: phosphotransferase [Microlunatus sp.]|nr:phosphotransferase [Microlunatus sp.]
MLPIPEVVRTRAINQGAQSWLAGLDELVTVLCAEWGVRLGAVLDGGTAALVATVRLADGTQAVLKVVPPYLEFLDQLRLLELAGGHGYVRVLRSRPDAGAVLLERLGARLETAGDVEFRLGVLWRLLPEAWRVPTDAYLGQSWDKAEGLGRMITELWPALGQPCPEPVIEAALGCADRRARAGDQVVVHGDPHPANALRVLAPRPGSVAGHVFIDPEGFLCDPAYDVGVTLRDWTAVLLAEADPRGWMDAHCAVAAERTGLDRQAIRDWTFLERVSSGLFICQVADPDHGIGFLRTAELLL